ncbi:MAG: Uma2 family endonuclease [Myxococcaceae bacterium]
MRSLHHRYTWHEYLVLGQSSNTKHEFCDGEIFAMAGGTPAHSELAVAVASAFHAQLEGKPCRTYNSDLRIRVLSSGLGTYPDVTVVCGPRELDPEDKNTVVNPVVLVEVLSDSTEAYDLGEKFQNYKTISSLQEYVVVSHREASITVWRRGTGAEWTRFESRVDGIAQLESINCRLDVNRTYAGVELSSR